MSTQTVGPKPQASANLVQIGTTIEDTIQQRLAEERARLEREAGVVKREVHHFKRPAERYFTKDQRAETTLLFGGLTWKHEKLVHGALEGLGYRAEAVPTPNVKAFQAGKEYGNNGQCNPTYFTVGNLVQYLQSLEEQGIPKQETNWSGTIHLAGNAWDHAPPTMRSDDPPPNGCDISTVRVPHLTLDVLNSSVATAPCPADRVSGQ